MKKLRQKSVLATLLATLSGAVFAADDSDINRYEQAKLSIAYEGQAGHLLQLIAQRLHVGLVTYDIDTSAPVALKKQEATTIKQLNQQIEAQLSDADIHFQKIGKRLFLVAAKKDAEPLLAEAPKVQEQFVGEVEFEGESPVNNNTTTESSANNKAENAQKMKRIFDLATDKSAIASTKKKEPKYQVASKEELGLSNVRVTPFGTFLIFKNGVDTTQFNVNGQFEDIAQNDNIIAILHKTQNAPKQIEVSNANGKKLLVKMQASKSK